MSAIGVALPPQFGLTGAAPAANAGAATSAGSSNSEANERIVERMTGIPVMRWRKLSGAR
jgi:hypothetical protein